MRFDIANRLGIDHECVRRTDGQNRNELSMVGQGFQKLEQTDTQTIRPKTIPRRIRGDGCTPSGARV